MNPMSPQHLLARTESGAQSAATASEAKQSNPEVVKAARQFEALFVRMMLEPLQRTAEMKKATPGSGGGAYGSMVVDALSDSITESGGVGLVQMIEEALAGSRGRVP